LSGFYPSGNPVSKVSSKTTALKFFFFIIRSSLICKEVFTSIISSAFLAAFLGALLPSDASIPYL